MGRYHYWRLHPFTLDELPEGLSKETAYKRLLTLGGFPEPFLSDDEREARRWRRERFDRVIKEDVRELSAIQQISTLYRFVDALRERVGSMIALSNIAQDLQVSPNTAKNWLAIVERMYLAFTLTPYTKKIARAVQTPRKVYFYDNADLNTDEGAKLENLVATHL
jgi:predicted AAA+ superfamily ATPase